MQKLQDKYLEEFNDAAKIWNNFISEGLGYE